MTTLRSSLAFINIQSDDPAKSRAFFEQLFGIDLVPSLWSEESYHAPISADGIDLDINARHQQPLTAHQTKVHERSMQIAKERVGIR